MAATDSVMYSLDRNWEMVEGAVAGLDEEMLARQPNEHSNSMAWMFGHINRVTDMFIMQRLQSKPELWLADGWCEKYGLKDNVEGLGMGQTVEQISAWTPPPLEVQLGYFEAVKAIARDDQLTTYVQKLESQYDESTPVTEMPEPAEMVRDLEQFLRSEQRRRPGDTPQAD